LKGSRGAIAGIPPLPNPCHSRAGGSPGSAEANGRRGAVVFEQAARLLMGQASRQLRRESQELLYLLDSTSITLKGPGFDAWTQGNSTRNTQGIKLHLLYAAHEQIPLQHSFTAANVNDVSEGIKLPIERGATYVFDKGYCDYNWWANIDAQHARFVTRFKYNAALRVDTSRPIAAADRDTILEDQIVRFAYRHQGGGRRNRYEKPLRRIVVHPGFGHRPALQGSLARLRGNDGAIAQRAALIHQPTPRFLKPTNRE
jgi:putative transposase